MRTRLLAAVLALTLLGACSQDELEPPEGRTSLSPESTAEPGDGGALDAVASTLELRQADEDSFVDDLLLDPGGQPVLLLSSSSNDNRQLMRPTATEGWTVLRESDLGADVRVGRLLTAGPDGVLAVGVQGGRLALFEIAADGSATIVPVTGAPDGLEYGLGWSAADGRTVYVTFQVGDGPSTVAAVDIATGDMTASTASPPGARFVGLAGTDLVFLDTGTVEERHAEITRLTRLTADLQPAGAVEVAASYVRSAGGVAGTVYASRLVADDDDSLGEVSLLAVPDGADEAETVWSVPDTFLLSELGAPAVDPDARWAYLPTVFHEAGGDGLLVQLTPVDLRTGDPAGTVTLCEGYQFGAMVVAPDGDRAFTTARCNGSGVPTLFTLR